jgi:hypothetical protein
VTSLARTAAGKAEALSGQYSQSLGSLPVLTKIANARAPVVKTSWYHHSAASCRSADSLTNRALWPSWECGSDSVASGQAWY